MNPAVKTAYDDEDSIHLLTSLLVRYPEVCTINYSPRGNLLKLTFILKTQLEKKHLRHFEEELLDCIGTYMFYENRTEPQFFKVNHEIGPGITILEITRDTATLTQKELALLVRYLHVQFDEVVVCEETYMEEEELDEQDDIIRNMLDRFRKKNPKNKFIAVREEGRVLVFKR